MPNPYPVEIKKGDTVAVEGEATFTDPGNQPDSGSIPQGGPLTATLDADGQAIENVGGLTVQNTAYFDPEGVDEPALKIGPSTEPPDDGNHAQLFLDSGTLKVKLPGGDVFDVGPLPWRGAWLIGTTYDPADLVEHDGSVYIAIATSTGSEPPSANWDTIVSPTTDLAAVLAVGNDADGQDITNLGDLGVTGDASVDGDLLVGGRAGFYGAAAVAQRTLTAASATPEQIATALIASTLMAAPP